MRTAYVSTMGGLAMAFVEALPRMGHDIELIERPTSPSITSARTQLVLTT